MTTFRENPDGTRHWIIDGDSLEAASLLDDPEAPELTEEQFERLREDMREVRERASSLQEDVDDILNPDAQEGSA